MDPKDLTSAEIRKAKILAKGPLGQALGKVPLLFARSIFFGPPPSPGQLTPINNGTITLVQLGARRLAITCSHVLDAFERRLAEDPTIAIQIGEYNFNPEVHVLSRSHELDLVVLDLSDAPLERVTSGPWLGTVFHQPAEWPAAAVTEGDFVSLAGYPGALRDQRDSGELDLHAFPIGTVPVRAVGDDYFIIQLERDFWVQTYGAPPSDLLDLRQLGGMSGGPVVIERKRASGVIQFDLVGIIYECSEDFDLVRVRPTSLIDGDGKILSER